MIIRSYFCDACSQEFEVTCESSDGDPDCPTCSTVLEWRPGMFAIKGNRSRALDVTQDVLEKDFGLTDWKDSTREGETIVKSPVEATTSEKDAAIRRQSEIAQQIGVPLTEDQAKAAAGFWGGGQIAQSLPVPQLLSQAKMATAAANAEGTNPMTLLHKAGKAGKLPIKMNVIARA